MKIKKNFTWEYFLGILNLKFFKTRHIPEHLCLWAPPNCFCEKYSTPTGNKYLRNMDPFLRMKMKALKNSVVGNRFQIACTTITSSLTRQRFFYKDCFYSNENFSWTAWTVSNVLHEELLYYTICSGVLLDDLFWGITKTTEAGDRKCSEKKVLLKISQNSHENNYARFLFLMNLRP